MWMVGCVDDDMSSSADLLLAWFRLCQQEDGGWRCGGL